MNECIRCGFNDADYGCTCPSYDKWYACPIESKEPEKVQALKEYAEHRKGKNDDSRIKDKP